MVKNDDDEATIVMVFDKSGPDLVTIDPEEEVQGAGYKLQEIFARNGIPDTEDLADEIEMMHAEEPVFAPAFHNAVRRRMLDFFSDQGIKVASFESVDGD